jgi:hypothetical protein
VIQRIQAASFVGETERLGVRYVDFFEGDVFSGLHLHLAVNDQPLSGISSDNTSKNRLSDDWG